MKPEFEGRRRGTGWSVAKGLAGRKLLVCAAVTVALSGCSSAGIPSTSGLSAGVPTSVAATTKPAATAKLAGTFTTAATPLVAAYFSASVPLKTGQVLFVGGCAN